MWRTSIPLATHQFPRSPHIFCAFCPVLYLLLLWTVLLGHHQDLWLCDLLSDGSHEQPVNEVVEALSPNTLIQFHSLPYRGTSLRNTLSTCLRFGQLQSNFRQLLTGYIAGVVETFESLIWLSERPVWNFLSCLLLLIPHTCLPAAAVYPLWAFSVPLPSASVLKMTPVFTDVILDTRVHGPCIRPVNTSHGSSLASFKLAKLEYRPCVNVLLVI